MLFNVAGLLKEETGASRSHELDDETLETPEGAFRDIAGPVSLLRTDRGVLVIAEIAASTTAMCSRCLDPANLTLAGILEEEYLPLNADLVSGHGTEAGVQQPEADADSLFIDARNMLDLSEAVRQSLIAAVPIAPVCDPGCKGLCPQCSVNRNVASCECVETATDLRWGPLAKLSISHRN